MSCTSGCRTKDHTTYGECLQAKSLRIGGCRSVDGVDSTAIKRSDRELDLYSAARAQGIQPSTTKTADVRKALDVSDATGTAYRAR